MVKIKKVSDKMITINKNIQSEISELEGLINPQQERRNSFEVSPVQVSQAPDLKL